MYHHFEKLLKVPPANSVPNDGRSWSTTGINMRLLIVVCNTNVFPLFWVIRRILIDRIDRCLFPTTLDAGKQTVVEHNYTYFQQCCSQNTIVRLGHQSIVNDII
jgi:hypothetical protein